MFSHLTELIRTRFKRPNHSPTNNLRVVPESTNLKIDQNDDLTQADGVVEESPKKHVIQLEELAKVGEGIATQIDRETVINRATRLIKQHCGYHRVTIFLPFDEQNTVIFRSASYSSSDGALAEHLTFKSGQGLVGWVAENKTSMLANNIIIESPDNHIHSDFAPTRSELAVPILVDDKLIGVLDIQSPSSNAFDDNDVRVMRMVSGQIAAAMENARLYAEIRRQLKERERRENILRIQRDLLVRLNTTTTMKETLVTTLDVLSSELNASRAVILLVDNETQALIYSASFNSVERPVPTTPLVNPDIAEWVARTAVPILCQQIGEANKNILQGKPSILYIPLLLDKKVIGVITLESGSGHIFSQEDMQAVNNLANSLVMLIEQARLFEEVQKARAELETRATELEDANAHLLELDRLKSQFLANISHELRTPLNSIIGFSEVMVDDLAGPLNDEQKEYSQDILDSGRYLLSLINNLLDFSKASAHQMELRISTFSVERLFSELNNSVAPMISRKSQDLQFLHDPSLPFLKADYLRIKQVFFNLISNAIKFTPNKGKIRVSCLLVDANELLFEVSDTGIGIRPEDHEIIFEEYRQVDGSLTRELPGTGLGLTISRRIIDLHNGKIWVESDLGNGATFFVRLPIDCCPT